MKLEMLNGIWKCTFGEIEVFATTMSEAIALAGKVGGLV